MQPSKPYTFRNTDEQTLRDQLILPGIPVMPIGYRDAIKVLQSMDGCAESCFIDFFRQRRAGILAGRPRRYLPIQLNQNLSFDGERSEQL